ncbi:hypothetical protein [Microvirga tunisiensis]|uniref:Uncharacterized protein n=1 Tax=Microvirga tunisiensis TaxID=2108360 RepID=A0A5N7MXL8_9HYPH|nr:hypothetical protein [Microvirga tunisiensis]MPR13856.1 hypothetical protein [Microvirga tunisiensis]MPR31685.1 hypothetical protein [Microvirga tunisiensis]
MPRELLDEPEETSIANGLCNLDLSHLTVEGSPAHALGLVDGVSDAAIRSEALAVRKRLVRLSITHILG